MHSTLWQSFKDGQDQVDASPSLFPKSLSRSPSFNSNANKCTHSHSEQGVKGKWLTVFTFSCRVSSTIETAIPQLQLVKQARSFFVMHTGATYNLHECAWTTWEICLWKSLMDYVCAYLLDQNSFQTAGLVVAHSDLRLHLKSQV